jgi:hypothetical protein
MRRQPGCRLARTDWADARHQRELLLIGWRTVGDGCGASSMDKPVWTSHYVRERLVYSAERRMKMEAALPCP